VASPRPTTPKPRWRRWSPACELSGIRGFPRITRRGSRLNLYVLWPHRP
jgi:hypothetical protein